MNRRLSKYLLLFLCMIFLWHMHAYASDNNTAHQGMKESQWKQLISDKAFGYKDEKEYAIQKEKEPSDNTFSDFWSGLINFFTGGSGQVITWLVLFGILAYLLYFIALSNNKSFLFSRSKKIKKEEEATETLEDIGLTDWDARIQDAIKSDDYRLAIRYSYIRLLQLLQDRELIAYRSDKTNFEYYNELNDTPYKPAFKQLSRQYEYAWYGHYTLPQASFEQYMNEFDQLKKLLS